MKNINFNPADFEPVRHIALQFPNAADSVSHYDTPSVKIKKNLLCRIHENGEWFASFYIPSVYLCLFILLSAFYSCKKENSDNKAELISRFEGKYKIVRATSDQAVDLDLNGMSSSDLLFEIANLKNSYLELRLNTQTGKFLYAQFWQNQYVKIWDNIGGNSNVWVDFANQPSIGNFDVDLEGKRLLVTSDTVNEDFPLPLAVNILTENRLKVFMNRKVYTASGWGSIQIEVEYERFTTEL